MKKTAVLLFAFAALALPAAAIQTGHAVYRPGLTQARIPFPSEFGYLAAYEGVPNLASNLLAIADEPWRDRTLGVFKDGGNANAATNGVSGKTWPWLIEHNHGVFAYEGQMFVEAGTVYSFYGRNYNGEALVLDGETRVWQGPRNAWNYAPEFFGSWTPAKSGWVDFNAWLWSWNGSHGPVIDKCAWGLQWNPDGIVPAQTETSDVFALAKDTNVWSRFSDPGNGTFFRTVTGERFTTVTNSFAAQGGRTFELAFTGVPTNAQLVAFTGPADGFHDTNGWACASAVLAEVPPSNSTAAVTVPLAADARVLRFRLAHFDAVSTNGLDVFEEWTEMEPVTAAPVVRISSDAPGWTNVVVAGSLESFGIGGDGAVVMVEVAEADDATFLDPVSSAVLPPFASVGDFEIELFGLSTNTAYLVRATATNQLGTSGVSAPVAFSTRDPGAPSASVAATIRGYQTATFRATVSDWGGGSWGAEAWIDVSEDDTFPAGATQTLPLDFLSGALPATVTATAEGLEPDTDHHARIRVTNSWGVAFTSETVPFRTSDIPLGFHEPEVVTSVGYVSTSLSPSFVVPGTVYDVELFAAGPGYSGIWETWNSEKDDPPFTWGRKTAAGRDVLIRYTVDWRYPATGASGQIVIEATTTAKLADRTVDKLPAIDPDYSDDDGRHGAYLRPGDTVELIPSDGARIDWHTNAVLSIVEVPREGTNSVFVLEALEPGATLLYETDLATGKTNNVTGVAIVLPTNNPAGGIYVRRTLADFTWTDINAWEMVAAGPQGYPDAPGAWVYIATPALGTGGPNRNIQITKPVTVGNLAVGQLGWIHHGYPKAKSHWSWTFGDNAGLGGAIEFDSGDGSESRILTLGHAYNVSRVQFQVPVSAVNDLTVDELWRIQDDIGGWANTWDFGMSFERPVDFGTNTFRNIRGLLYHYPATKVWSSVECNGSAARGFLQFYDDILGSGTIRLEADSMVGCVQSSVRELSFTGTWDVANGQNISCYGGSGFTWPGTSLGRSRELIVRGSWLRADPLWNGGAFARNADEGSNWHMFKGWTNDWWNVLPRKMTLDGGCLYLHPNWMQSPDDDHPAPTTWTYYEESGVRRIVYEMESLEIPSGPMGFLSIKKSDSDLHHPDQFTTITNLELAPGAVLAFETSDSSPNKTNEIFIVNEPEGWTDPSNADRQFLPYFFASQQLLSNPQYRGDKPFIVTGTPVDNTHLFFRDKGTGRVTREAADTTGTGYRRWPTDGGEELSGGTGYSAMLLGQNATNSFSAGATVQNLAGYLDMRGGAALGVLGADAGAAVDFGNEPARVYVGNWGETGTIGCQLHGSAGLVKGGSGTLALGASAEGVSGDVRVAGGTLALGVVVSGAGGTNTVFQGRVAGDVVVEAGSRLVVRDKTSFAPGVRLFLNDRDWIPSYAHVRMESDASVAKLFVCGEAMPNGYYGSSEAALVHPGTNVVVDDVHFEGPGLLWAGVRPTMLIFR